MSPPAHSPTNATSRGAASPELSVASGESVSRSPMFRNPLRWAIASILIFIALGQISGRILSIQSINTQTYEQTLRADLQDELKYLTVLAIEEGQTEKQRVYAETLQSQFQFDASKLQTEEAAASAKNAKAKATRRWPIQARRENWMDRGKEWNTASLIKKVIAETKYRREDLVAELKYLAVVAKKSNQLDDYKLYSEAIPVVLRAIANEQKSSSGSMPKKADAPPTFDPSELDDPKSIEQIKQAKQLAKHHWPIELRRRDIERMQKPWSEADLVRAVVQEVNRQRPFLSGNDRSRWLTVRSLVEFGTYEINPIIEYEPSWDSVDVVSHMNSDGEQKLYSSKPPLQATLMAAPYWLLYKTTGCTLGTHPFEIGRVLLILANVLPLGLAWWWCARILDQWCESDAAYVVIVASLCFATLLSTFAVAFTNHLWGAVAAVGATWYSTRCLRGEVAAKNFCWAGFWSAFVFTCELPAASFMAVCGLLLLWKFPKQTLVFSAPVVILVLSAYFGTNYIAHGKWSPPYSYGAGDVNTADSKTSENWYDYDYIRFLDGKKVDSYWRKPDNPLDQGEPSLSKYVFHATIGHHGILSLTPLLLMTIPGIVLGLRSQRREQQLWLIALAITSLACIVFYLFLLDVRQRNYGGTTSAFRQLLWLHPLWLIAAAPWVERLVQTKRGVCFVGVLAALSMVSVSYPHWNPWSQTWIWNWMVWLGIPPIG